MQANQTLLSTSNYRLMFNKVSKSVLGTDSLAIKGGIQQVRYLFSELMS